MMYNQKEQEQFMKIYLDDIREPDTSYTVFQSVGEELYKTIIENWDIIEEISLDHDLGNDEQGTGYDVLLFIEEYVYSYQPAYLPTIKVHSSNSSARIKMELAIQSIQKAFAKGQNMLQDTALIDNIMNRMNKALTKIENDGEPYQDFLLFSFFQEIEPEALKKYVFQGLSMDNYSALINPLFFYCSDFPFTEYLVELAGRNFAEFEDIIKYHIWRNNEKIDFYSLCQQLDTHYPGFFDNHKELCEKLSKSYEKYKRKHSPEEEHRLNMSM